VSEPPSPRTSPAHARGRHSSAAQQQLRALGDQAPTLSESLYRPIAHRRALRVVRTGLIVLVVVLVVAVVAVQLLRPIPAPRFHSAVTATLHVPGTPPALPWPAGGSASVALLGGGTLGSSGSTAAVPVAGLAKVMTAYVVLKDHPMRAGDDGANLPVSAEAVAAYQAEKANQESTVPLTAGATLTELQGLQGLLVASGNDIAVLLAQWDAGGTTPFVAKMNAAARSLGMTRTTFTDPSGLDAGTISTPHDLVKLGTAAMALPAFGPIVATTDVTLPGTGTFYNLDYDLGHAGIVGIKTGASSAAGGCFLFAATQTVAGQHFTVVGVVLGQRGTPQTGAAVDAAAKLVQATFAAAGPVPVATPGTTAGTVTTAWGATAPVGVGAGPTVVAVPGMAVPARVVMASPPSSFASGARLGVLRVTVDGHTYVVPLRALQALDGPTISWRLLHG
jgi:D-alanyl-D-alanine carboxypeptidase (penicillin-binding protein 5/6)